MSLAATTRPIRRIALHPRRMDVRHNARNTWQGDASEGLSKTRRTVLALSCLIVFAWAAALFVTSRAHTIVESSSLNVAVMAAIFALRLTAAGVLLVFPNDRFAPRLRWIGIGLLVQCLGAVVVTRIRPTLIADVSTHQVRYGLGVLWTTSGCLWLAGLLPTIPRPVSWRCASAQIVTSVTLASLVVLVADRFPGLVDGNGENIPSSPFHQLTYWHWVVSSLPIAIALIAVVFAIRRFANDGFGDGLASGLILFAGSSIHHAIWPIGFGAAVTSINVLRLASVVIIAAAGISQLRRLANARSHEIMAAQPTSTDRSVVLPRSSDLGAVVAHELGSSIAAMKGFVEILSLSKIDSAMRQQTIEGLRGEAAMLGLLAEDIQTLGAVQHHRLAVTPFPIDLGVLIGDAIGFARALPGEHRFRWPDSLSVLVLADPERIAQVLRNLLTNAAKYTHPPEPIDISVKRSASTVRISIVDRGPGIAATDQSRVFGMFDRGSAPNLAIPGTGVGLFVSRELIRSHGHDLTYEPTPGGGATFAFDLDIAR